jgi:hypothetical protein
MASKYDDHIRAKAIRLRTEQQMTLDEIVERLQLPKTTIYGWIREIPIPKRKPTPPQSSGQKLGTLAMQAKYAGLREQAYQQGWEEAPELLKNVSFRDFVVLYVAEGYRRNRNVVSFVNSDPRMIKLACRWIRELSSKKITYRIQYHVDQDLDELRRFWANLLDIGTSDIQMQRKSNSGKLAGRKFRSVYGVFTLTIGDTYLRARLEAWMDFVKQQW